MASLADWIKSQTADYGQLKNAYPNAMKFGSALKKGISQLVPTQGDLNSPQKMGEWGLSAALNAPMGMMFVGPKSAGWDAVKAQEAEKLLNAGVDPAQVWKEHLIGRMPDGKLFSEIDDSGAKYLNKSSGNVMENKINHENLFSEYPEFKKIKYAPITDNFANASYAPERLDWMDNYYPEEIGLNEKKRSTIKDKTSNLLHEFQHAIQHKEDWSIGSNLFDAYDFIQEYNRKIYNKISDIVVEFDVRDPLTREKINKLQASLLDPEKDVLNTYKRVTGEAQARATQDRMNMNMQQRRESYPLANDMLSDIPLGNLINRYGE